MNDEQYDEIINRLTEALQKARIGSDEFKAISEQLREFEKLRQSNEEVKNDYVRIVNEEEKSVRECEAEEFKAQLESDTAFRDQMIKIGLGLAGGATVLVLTWFGTVYCWENPVTNKSAVSLASTAMSKWLTKLI